MTSLWNLVSGGGLFGDERRPQAIRLGRAITALALAWGLTGCGPPTLPLDKPVDASSSRTYNMWYARQSPKWEPGMAERFDASRDTLRLELSVVRLGQTPPGGGTDILAMIDQATVRQVIAYGELVRLHRLALENFVDVEMLEANQEQYATLTADVDAAIERRVREQIDRIERRIRSRKKDIDDLEAGLSTLMPGVEFNPWTTRPHNRNELPLLLVQSRFLRPHDLEPPGQP